MHRVLILGAGKIGRMIAELLSQTGDYEVTIGDADPHSLERFHGHAVIRTIPLDAGNQADLIRGDCGSSERDLGTQLPIQSRNR